MISSASALPAPPSRAKNTRSGLPTARPWTRKPFFGTSSRPFPLLLPQVNRSIVVVPDSIRQSDTGARPGPDPGFAGVAYQAGLLPVIAGVNTRPRGLPRG